MKWSLAQVRFEVAVMTALEIPRNHQLDLIAHQAVDSPELRSFLREVYS